MNRRKKFAVILFLTAVFLMNLCVSVYAVTKKTTDSARRDTADYLCRTVSSPQIGSIGGEWTVMGLARSGCTVPDGYYDAYYKAVEKTVRDCGGVLHDRKYTEYSRVILALSAIGRDARNVAGYDLTKPLGDYEKTIWQGINGPVFALLALDSADYPMPQNPKAKTQATRQMYIDRILDYQLSDGGWSLNGSDADPDITGMALQALAKYRGQAKVAEAIERALTCISAQQNKTGGFSSWNTENSESTAQIIVALCELGITLDDPRFVKNGKTTADNLMTFYRSGNGFVHVRDGGSDLMATEQGFYALTAIKRAEDGKNSLYRMNDILLIGGGGNIMAVNRDPNVRKLSVLYQGKTFADIRNHTAQAEVEALAARGIINGKSETVFDPDASMTRAEFATIVVRALGLTPKCTNAFSDVDTKKWYAPYIGTASAFGIVNGVGSGKFNPSGTITRGEAAAMVARAAKLCGLDTARSDVMIRNTLSQFSDVEKAAGWARESLAFCYDTGITDAAAKKIGASSPISRAEIAKMLYRLLKLSGLL